MEFVRVVVMLYNTPHSEYKFSRALVLLVLLSVLGDFTALEVLAIGLGIM